MHLLQAAQAAAPTACQQHMRGDDRYRKDDADQALGQDIEREQGAKGPAKPARRFRLRLGAEVAEQRGGEQEADQQVRNVDAREDKDAEARKRYEARVEARAKVEGAAGERFRHQRKRSHSPGQREPRGGGHPKERTEELHRQGHQPIEERGLFEVADAVGVERHPVVPQQHLARNLGVH